MPNVRLFFNHKLTGGDFARRKAWFEDKTKAPTSDRYPEVEVDFDFMIGADGAHSAVRYHMMKFTRMEYHQEYIDTLWCEFQITPRSADPADRLSRFALPPNYLHIWPAREFMFIAIPSIVGATSRFLHRGGSVLTHPGRIVHLYSVPAERAFCHSGKGSYVASGLFRRQLSGRHRPHKS